MAVSSKSKQFEYEIQSFQEDCISNIIDVFEKLHQNVSLKTILADHYKANNYHFPIGESKNIDILMETGTGKTFTFIKTIFELNRNFGYNKFIILVPSVPIREGTKNSLEDTKEYFKSFYANERDKEIEYFVYEGGNISAIKQFIGATHLSALILTPGSFHSKENILNRPLEYDINQPELFISNQEHPKSYLECLKRLNPIIIMDEPHRFDGDAFKRYFKGFDNYYLRFGATYPQKKNSIPLSNVAYVLDSISSFRKNLVKKIVVYTQDIVDNLDTLIGIRDGKAIVSTMINGVVMQRALGIGDVFNGKSIRRINKNSLVFSDDTREEVEYSLSDESLRSMIRRTIQIHFEKEEKLFNQGIKALTLFFIESDTTLFRGDNPKIKNIFEEEYINIRKEVLDKIDSKVAYYKYLQNDFDPDNRLQVHKGYFSGDKGNKDEKIKAGVDEILKDKKGLLSFDSPTRFIFSIWALQEGWDNPNVFTLCKLSNQGSEISKLQQIGRGLRICVNQNLQRKTLKYFDHNQDAFWEVNNLDVIVSSKEQGFVEGIQKEILNNSNYVSNSFTEQELIKIIQEKSGFDDDLVIKLVDDVLKQNKIIIRKAIIDGTRVYEKSSNFNSLLKAQNLPESQEKVLMDIFAGDAREYIKKSEENKEKKNILIKNRHLNAFKELWSVINKDAFYIINELCEENENQLIQNIKREIEALDIDQMFLQTIRAELHIDRVGKNDSISEKIIATASHTNEVDYLELVRNLSNNTKTPISFIVKVFNSLSSDFKSKMLCNNPAQAQREITEIIRRHLVEMIKLNVRYDGINGEVLPNIFRTKHNKTFLAKGSIGKFQKDITHDFSLKEKWVFEEVIEYDSDFELEIVEEDPDIDSIEIFGKLPRLKIKTPLGEYNPDFCYAIKKSEGSKLFLVVESKGYETSTAVPDREKAKIDFAKKYFEALNEYYKDKNIKISFQERINTTQLSSLINKL